MISVPISRKEDFKCVYKNHFKGTGTGGDGYPPNNTDFIDDDPNPPLIYQEYLSKKEYWLR